MASVQPVSPWVPLPCSCQGGLASSELLPLLIPLERILVTVGKEPSCH